VIVSLTSHPRRIGLAWKAIRSLLLQTYSSRVVLVLSLEEFPDRMLPSRLDRLQSNGLEIVWVAGNSRSYQKLLPIRAREPAAIVVTADDDVFYPRWWLSELMRAHGEHPESVLAHRAKEVCLADSGRLCPYVQWGHATTKTPSKRVFATAHGGILYPPHALPDIALDEKLAMRLSPTADDVWFWAMGLLAEAQVAVVSDRFREFITVPGSHDSGLFHMNVFDNQNDAQLERVLDHFGLWEAIA